MSASEDRESRGEPWPHPWDLADHCHFHGHEPICGEPYLICGECGHCYMTSNDLVRYFWNLVRLSGKAILCYPTGEPVNADDILFCPLCSHGF